jgi:hypothetical protein
MDFFPIDSSDKIVLDKRKTKQYMNFLFENKLKTHFVRVVVDESLQ